MELLTQEALENVRNRVLTTLEVMNHMESSQEILEILEDELETLMLKHSDEMKELMEQLRAKLPEEKEEESSQRRKRKERNEQERGPSPGSISKKKMKSSSSKVDLEIPGNQQVYEDDFLLLFDELSD